jgi:FlaG/FlaF family flagellin (archaellin)
VSEIIGTLLLLMITVALFSVVFVWATRLPTPERVPYVDLTPFLDDGGDGWGNGNEKIVIEHRGGEPIFANQTRVIIRIDDRELVAERENLNFNDDYMYMGDTWVSSTQRITNNSTVYASVYYVGQSTMDAIMPEQRLIPRLRSLARADLTLYKDEVSYNPPVVKGQNVMINTVVRNIARGDSGPFSIALYDGNIDEGRIISTVEVPNIKGQSSTRGPIIYPNIPFDPVIESRNVTIVLDYLNSVQESNERNNVFTITISARGSAAISLIENFEYGAPGWEHGGKQDEWELGGPVQWNGPQWYMYPDSAHWGSNCWGTDLDNTYNNNADFWLLSPEVNLANATEAKIEFYHWYYFETEWDFGTLEITTDGGKTWSTLREYTGSQTQWIYEEIDLSEYLGNLIQVRFHVKTDSYGTSAGWYIDDLSIIGNRKA